MNPMSYYIKARIKQIQLAIGKTMRKRSHEVHSSSVLVTEEVTREYDEYDKPKEETQAIWYVHVTKTPLRQEEVMFNK